STLHHRQPLARLEAIVYVDVVVVVFPVPCACIVWRIYIDAVKAPCAGPLEQLQHTVILTFDDDVVWPAITAFQRGYVSKGRKNGLTRSLQDDEFAPSINCRFAFFAAIFDATNPVASGINHTKRPAMSSIAQPNQSAHSDSGVRKRYVLRDMPLE
ncbi:hypothetical protein, partial [Sinorhizobium fredii]|uniref:hypothetical protein n=1 Tax=Rhizobium fredii TaxID=380 RepID=UPI0035124210